MYIMHVDANSAYLSWTAAALLEKGYPTDLRTIPSVIAGDPRNRHGIVLAKSIACKNIGIKTGESLFEARQKCPGLVIESPDYDLYMGASDAMYRILSEYSSLIQRYSIDECFMDYTCSKKRFGSPERTADEIRKRIKEELGFTVNVGVSVNKLLAKMASDFKKPDRVHTLWPYEIKNKMWPLPVRKLFMVGRASEQKLSRININTIGDLAKSDPAHMEALMKSHGLLIWKYANGIDHSSVIPNNKIPQKGLGGSTTVKYDVLERHEAKMILLGLTERISMRLRRLECMTSLISVSVKTTGFIRYSHEARLKTPVNSTREIFFNAGNLFDQCWKGEPIRYLGIYLSDLSESGEYQLGLFDHVSKAGNLRLDFAVDSIRKKYGDRAVIRGVFANSGIDPLQGGVNDGDYIMMGGRRSENTGRAD